MPSTSASQCTLLPFTSGGVNLTYVPFSPLIFRVNLMQLIEEATEGCWIGHQARMFTSEIGSVYSPPKQDRSGMSSNAAKWVETVIDVEYAEPVSKQCRRRSADTDKRLQGWVFKCEKGGIRRVLMNLFGNSLKFTSVSCPVNMRW